MIELDHEDMLMQITQVSDSVQNAHKRLDVLEKQMNDIHDLAIAMAKINTNVDNLKKDIEEVKDEVKKVADRPRMWWDKAIAALIGAVVTGIVGAVLSLILINK